MAPRERGPRAGNGTPGAFSVQRRSDGAYRLPQQQLEVVTRFTVSDDNLLAQEGLREEARQELRHDATRRLLDRLRALE
ncbi:hypothetical protein Q427_15505 [Halomonas sp. BC04]|nr:hypothetical protein Q427_15505 [Halomonas sp. BC04]